MTEISEALEWIPGGISEEPDESFWEILGGWFLEKSIEECLGKILENPFIEFLKDSF